MQVHGHIELTTKPYEGKSAEIYTDSEATWMSIDTGRLIKKVNLNKELANVDHAETSRKSAKRVLARTALAGMAGATSSRGTSYALLGAASTFGLEKSKYHVALRLKNTETYAGETVPEVIDILQRLSPKLSDDQLLRMRGEKDKIRRYVMDAPRTVHETRETINKLRHEIEEIENNGLNAPTFDAREAAKNKHAQLTSYLHNQQQLLTVLENTVRGLESFNSPEEYQKALDAIDSEIELLQAKVAAGEDMRLKKKHIPILICWFIGFDFSKGNTPEDTNVAGFFMVLAFALGIRAVMPKIFLGKNRRKLAELIHTRDNGLLRKESNIT